MHNLIFWAIVLLLWPILLPQAIRTRRRTLRLPEAAGPNQGEIPGAGPPIRLVVLGESTAAGVGAATQAEALAGQTAYALARETGRPVHWLAVGRIGATAHSTCHDLVSQLPHHPVDRVILALGVNDTTRLHTLRRWTADLQQVIAAVRQRVGPAPILLTGVPPLDRFPALPQPLRRVIGLRGRLLDQAAANLAQHLPNVTHHPIPTASSDTFAPDGYHPSPAGYQAWGAHLAEAIAGEIRRQETENGSQ